MSNATLTGRILLSCSSINCLRNEMSSETNRSVWWQFGCLLYLRGFFFHSFFVTRRLVLERVTRFTHSGWSTNNSVWKFCRYFGESLPVLSRAREVPTVGNITVLLQKSHPQPPLLLLQPRTSWFFGVTVCRDVYSLRRNVSFRISLRWPPSW